MRILNIEIENLNSLKGHWTIDFTHQDYETYHNLFVISGETGSGKTTILDAITLALYGRTARQDSVGKSTNEIMTRGAKSCMASVTYECRKGKFKSTFTQETTRNGTLKNPSWMIENLTEKEIFTGSAAKTLSEKSSTIIQLDYTQFSRSMMLAQGEFDTFIMGKEEERASILSKLNGTDIYKKIGEKVWGKWSEKKNNLERIENELRGIEVLSEEEIEELKAEEKSKKETIENNTKKITKIDSDINYVEKLENATAKLEHAKTNRQYFLTEKEAFKEDEKRLIKGEKASNCDLSYKDLKDNQDSYSRTEKNISDNKASLQETKSQYEISEKDCTKACDAYKSEEEEVNSNRVTYNKVRALDTKLEASNTEVSNLKKDLDAIDLKIIKGEEAKNKAEKKLGELKSSLKDIREYLTRHEEDNRLTDLCDTLNKKEVQLKALYENIQKANCSYKTSEDKFNKYSLKKTELESEYEALLKGLQDFVSKEFLSISNILRSQLVDNQPCPVCGSLSHPTFKKANTSTEDQKVIQDVGSLNKQLELKSKELEQVNGDIREAENNIKAQKEIIEDSHAQYVKIIGELNGLMEEWGYEIKSHTEITSLNTTFKTKSNAYKNKEKEETQVLNEIKVKETERDSIDIPSLTKEKDTKEASYKDSLEKKNSLLKERKELFADKDPDEEEAKDNRALNLLKKDKEDKEKAKIKLSNQVTAFESSIKELTKAQNNYKERIDQALPVFESALKENGFKNKEEYLASSIDRRELQSLKNKKEELIKKDSSTKEALDSSEKDFKAIKEDREVESLQTLKDKKATLTKENTDFNQRLGSIKEALKNNEANKSKVETKEKERQIADKEFIVWSQMREFTGKKDGADFEVFVQSLAFKQLLIKANKYIEAITGRYSLVQIEGKVDFKVHDHHYEDKEDRPISNMSGGEKFIISLSLALALSELASRNVRVDSLFLDEGFGTLSGEPLEQSIEALKSLQSKGKMLGIITHVDTVINAFDLKLEARKNSNGTSILEGSGVTFTA